ncbi:hypothetical protein BDW72DRAFT_38529 [Aspergillus terricola var. indicus]
MSEPPERRRSSVKAGFLVRRFASLSRHDTNDLKRDEPEDDFWGPLGLNLLHEPSESLVDFVFVHGLGGGSRKTWSKTEIPGHYWPKEWLPREPHFKHVRIHSFGYNSDWRERASSILTIHDFGQALLGDIYNSPSFGQNAKQQTPIILVGHSMGGLVIKKVLLLARHDPHYNDVAARIRSLFFLATPHRGADMAKLLRNLLTLHLGDSSKPYVDSLAPQSDAIQTINDQFRHSYQGVQLWSFFETEPTILGRIVDKSSAVLELPGEKISHLLANHSNVCKFDSPSDPNYCRLRDAFITAIRSIELPKLSSQSQDTEDRMKSLSQYLGLVESPLADYMNKIEHRTDGSCSWLTDKDSFLDWLDGDRSPRCFWLSGEPASGKSTMAAHVIHYLEECNQDCAYFFFKDGSTRRSRTANLLCSLAYQMAATNQDIRDQLWEMCESGIPLDRKDERTIWRTIFTSRILRARLRQTQYWVIDALDECENYPTIFPFLAKVQDSFPLRIFFTSRPSLSIERLMSYENIPKVSDSITPDASLGDIRLFVQAHSPYFLTESDEERKDLEEDIIVRSNGNFLWTYLVVRKIMDAVSAEQVHDILMSVPDEISHLYSHILGKIMSAPETEAIACGILRWTLCALRPLYVGELQEALRLDIGKTLYQLDRTVGSICGNLVVVDSSLRIMAAHQTLREYVFQGESRDQFSMIKAAEHARITDVCLAYLSSDALKSPHFRQGRPSSVQKVKRSPFAAYATVHFSDHLVRASSTNPTHLVAINKFLTTNALAWIETVAMSKDLAPLIQAAQNMNAYLERRAKYESPLGSEIQNATAWATDIIHLVAQFGNPLTTSPQSIFYLIPAVCPRESVIAKASKASPRRLQVKGLSQSQWDDRLCCIVIPATQVLSVACNDTKLALGVSAGKIYIYREATFQEELQLHHGEPVRRLSFASAADVLISSGQRKLCCWNVTAGEKQWEVPIEDEAVALRLGQDDMVLYVVTKTNRALILESKSGDVIDSFRFCDWDEEERCEHRYRRPPIYADISPTAGRLGVAYRQRPVNFWSLEGYEYEGQFHRSRVAYPEPLIHAFIFNPNPELNLAAVSFQDGVTMVFDPEKQNVQATADTDASVLGASPDGTVLAAGTGDGIIKLYDFETMKLLKQIFLQQEAIRALSFNSTGTRIFDIRGNYCNVWEPSVLVRRSASDDSSVDISERISEPPDITKTLTWAGDLLIVSVVPHHRSDIVFCGRENGSITAYATKTGQLVQELCSHTHNVAIDLLLWNKAKDILVSTDRSGRVVARRIVQKQRGSFEISEPILHEAMSSLPRQILMNADGTRLMVSMNEKHALWDLTTSRRVQERSTNSLNSKSWRWTNHPQDDDLLLLFVESRAQVYSWRSFDLLSTTAYGLPPSRASTSTSISSSGEETDTELRLDIAHAIFPAQCRNICLVSSRAKPSGNNQAPKKLQSNQSHHSMHLLPAKSLPPQTANPSTFPPTIPCHERSLKDLKAIIGVYGTWLVFLQNSGWVCSINLETSTTARSYTRHFFVPLPWHSTITSPAVAITPQGSIILSVRDEIAVFHAGLDSEELVPD